MSSTSSISKTVIETLFESENELWKEAIKHVYPNINAASCLKDDHDVTILIKKVFYYHIPCPIWYEQYKLFERYNHMFLNYLVTMAEMCQQQGTSIGNFRVPNPL